MAPYPRWAELQPELLVRIGDRLDLKGYASARCACTAWRCALAPPLPALLVVADADRRCPYAASLATRRSFELTAIVSESRCVGSSNDGWLALSIAHSDSPTVFVLFNPIIAVEIRLPPLIYNDRNRRRWISEVSKVVFTRRPAMDDFAAAAIIDSDTIAYVTASARMWAVTDPVCLTSKDYLTDVVYSDKGDVYCLTNFGDVHVLRLPERRRRKPYTPSPSESQGSHLDAPATVEPLLCEANLPFNPATVFAPPYDTVLQFMSAKNLVFCEGNLYQVWRNESCTVTLHLPAGGRRRVAEHEILVLRYYPHRQPCWNVVKDLGGHSLFVGRNNVVSMYAEGVPGLRGNCVYWIGGRGRDQGMVFDMESGRSPCRRASLPGHPHSTVCCWYFLSDGKEHQQQLHTA